MARKTLDEQLQELQQMLIDWNTHSREDELVRVELQRKVKEIRKYAEGLIKI